MALGPKEVGETEVSAEVLKDFQDVVLSRFAGEDIAHWRRTERGAWIHRTSAAPASGVGARSLISYYTKIHSDAIIGEGVFVGPNCQIESNARIRNNVKIGKQTYIGEWVCIGENTELRGSSAIYSNVDIERNCFIDECVEIGTYASINEDVLILSYVNVGPYVEIGEHVILTSRIALHEGSKISCNQIIRSNPLYIQGSLYQVYTADSEHIGVGCTMMPFQKWVDEGDRLADSWSFSQKQKEEYARHIKYAAEFLQNWDTEIITREKYLEIVKRVTSSRDWIPTP